MTERIVHLCYAGTSGSTRVAVNIAAGSTDPARHAYVFYGTCTMRADYGRQLEALGCAWRYARKQRGWLWPGYRRIAREIIRLGPAVVVLHGSRSLPVGRHVRRMAPGVKIVAVQHGPSRELTSWWRRDVCRRFSLLADRTVTVSEEMAAMILSRPSLAKACQPLTVIPNGLEVDYWSAEPTTISPDTPLRLAMVAVLAPYKDHATLLHAARLLFDVDRDVHLRLVGGGWGGDLGELIDELGLVNVVSFEGDVERAGVRRIMHESDVIVHATKSESFGMAVVEAMLASRPVVATRCVGVREIIEDDETGLLVPEGDAAALARAIERLMDDGDLARRLAEAARTSAVERFDCRRMARAYESLVDEMLTA
ncbi:MAG: glycosyltransferase [Planctomycetota bacterium]|jgi:glycosyltransferase involved in cell wall biosynthesis